MSENHTDNPYAPSSLIEDETKPVWWFDYVHYVLVVLAALPALFCLVSPLLLEYRAGWQNAMAFLFVVGYIGLFFRKQWAYWICAVVPFAWFVQIVVYLANATPNPNEQGLVMIFTMIYLAFAVWFAIITLLALRCAMTCRRQRNSRVSNAKVEP